MIVKSSHHFSKYSCCETNLCNTPEFHSKNLNSEYIVRLFDQTNINEDKKDISPERSKSREKIRNY
jgi:hypothetical protein